jgi:2-polyprenyl-3-methyl-5-hydroxy-6-metoxy-1,4-benzoquinol methylase
LTIWTTDPAKHWIEWGKRDPYFGVFSSEQYKTGTMDAAARARFFSTGEEEIGAALATIRARLDDTFTPRRSLDFGCGVGRTTIPIARGSGHAVGVDISTDMLAEAARNAATAGVSNVEWVQSDAELSRLSGSFDFIYSIIVLHHIRPTIGYRIIRRLLSSLSPGGVVALQILYQLETPPPLLAARWVQAHVPGANVLVNLLRRRPLATPNMEGNVYDLPTVLNLLDDAGCREPLLQLQHQGPVRHAMIFAQKRREASPTRGDEAGR